MMNPHRRRQDYKEPEYWLWQPIDNPTDAESRQYRITRNGVEFTISQDGDLWRVASSLGDIGFRYLTLFFAMQACSLTLKLGNVRHEYIVGWPIEAQQRAWVITVASSPSAVDSEEVQTLLSKWTAWGQLTTTEWEGMKALAQYVTSPQYVEDETNRKMVELGLR